MSGLDHAFPLLDQSITIVTSGLSTQQWSNDDQSC